MHLCSCNVSCAVLNEMISKMAANGSLRFIGELYICSPCVLVILELSLSIWSHIHEVALFFLL